MPEVAGSAHATASFGPLEGSPCPLAQCCAQRLHFSPLGICRSCSGNCPHWGASAATPRTQQGASPGFQPMAPLCGVGGVHPSIETAFMAAPKSNFPDRRFLMDGSLQMPSHHVCHHLFGTAWGQVAGPEHGCGVMWSSGHASHSPFLGAVDPTCPAMMARLLLTPQPFSPKIHLQITPDPPTPPAPWGP